MRNALVKTFARLRRDEKGVTLVEYGIALILAVTVGAATLGGLATKVQGKMNSACGALTTAGTNC